MAEDDGQCDSRRRGSGCRELEALRFDSDSFLGLDRHPSVVESVNRTLAETGCHTGSGQPPDGAKRRLRGLEQTVSTFHGREDTVVFPSARAAEEGAIAALLRSGDLAACDSFSNGGIDEAGRRSGVRRETYAHLDLAALDRVLEAEVVLGARRLVLGDGVFGVHGHVAPLPWSSQDRGPSRGDAAGPRGVLAGCARRDGSRARGAICPAWSDRRPRRKLQHGRALHGFWGRFCIGDQLIGHLDGQLYGCGG